MRMVLKRAAIALMLGAVLTAACRNAPSTPKIMHVQTSTFGRAAAGTEVRKYVLSNAHGIELTLISYGAAIASLKVPDRSGRSAEIVLGFDTLEPYLKGVPYFGAIVGRYGNRIARGHFTLDGVTYVLPINDGPNHLHGGPQGFDKRIWQGQAFENENGPGVEFTYVGADGEEGYPGRLTAHVVYQLRADNEVTISYEATTTKPTVINLTNHAYFNLSGDLARDILGEQLRINADRFTPVDETLIPTGELRSVAGTPFDFRKLTPIGARVGENDEQLIRGKGYDHNWVLNQSIPAAMGEAAELYDPASGRVMTVRTTQPGIQFYSGNFLDGSLSSRGVKFTRRIALCLETQHFPDSPNQPNFPSTVLRPGETYKSQTVLVFSTR